MDRGGERDTVDAFIHDDIREYFDEIKAIGRGEGSSSIIHRGIANARGAKLIIPGERHPSTERVLALKEVVVDDDASMDLLRSEVSRMRSVALQRGVRYYGCFINDDTLHAWIVMRFVDAPNLHDIILSGRLARSQKNLIAKQLALAIIECHSNGIVHRNITPSNIMISNPTSKTADVVLVDFGLSCSVSKCPLPDSCRHIRGALDYADQRIVIGDTTALMQADWWSYGQTVAFMYTNRRLFEPNDDQYWGGEYRALASSDLAHIPTRLHAMLSRLTDPNSLPSERPNASEILSSVITPRKSLLR